MIAKIIDVWHTLSDNGIRPHHTYEDIKRVRIINQSSVIGLVNTLLYAIILIVLDMHKFIKLQFEFAFIFDISFLFTLAACGVFNLWLIRKYDYRIGGIFLLVTFPTLLLTLSIVLDKIGIEYYYFPFFIILFYLLRYRRGLTIISIYYIILFGLSKFFDDYLNVALIVSDNTQIFYYVNVAVAFLSSYAFLRLFITEYEKKQQEVELKNTQLEKAVKIANQKSEEIQLLLKELSHRTKNNLQLVSSIINIQSGKITDQMAKNTIEDTRNRIHSMSLLHQKLYVNDNLNTFSLNGYIEDLINYLIDIFDEKSNNLRIIKEMEDIDIKIDNAVHIGLVINEILTNSFKHALMGCKDKFIKVVIKKTNEKDVYISIADCGEGIIKITDVNYSKSFGGSLICSLVKQMEGEISFNENEKNEIILRFNNIL
jgi:two-component sensor histidine kinase